MFRDGVIYIMDNIMGFFKMMNNFWESSGGKCFFNLRIVVFLEMIIV